MIKGGTNRDKSKRSKGGAESEREEKCVVVMKEGVYCCAEKGSVQGRE